MPLKEFSLRDLCMGRHPALQDIAQFFDYDHLPPHLQNASQPFYDLARRMVLMNADDKPQLTLALQDLLRSKDAFVRSMLGE